MNLDVGGAETAEAGVGAQDDLGRGRAAAVRVDSDEDVGGAHCDGCGFSW